MNGYQPDPGQIAAALVADTFATPAAILVAFDDDPALEPLRQDIPHIATLERLDCLRDRRVTALGEQVVDVLRSVHGVQAGPCWANE